MRIQAKKLVKQNDRSEATIELDCKSTSFLFQLHLGHNCIYAFSSPRNVGARRWAGIPNVTVLWAADVSGTNELLESSLLPKQRRLGKKFSRPAPLA